MGNVDCVSVPYENETPLEKKVRGTIGIRIGNKTAPFAGHRVSWDPLDAYTSVMNNITSGDKSGVTDSPWFWISLFCMGALVSLVLMQARYSQRQPQIERQYQARQQSGHSVEGRAEVTSRHAEGETLVRLEPLIATASLGLLVSWGMWLRQRAQVRKVTRERGNHVVS